MKALLKKDLFTVGKQMRFFFVVIVIFACLPGGSFSALAVMYAAMMPITALAFDEQAKWDALAAMMPYSKGAIVAGKYVLGYASVVAAALLSAAAQLVITLVKGGTADKAFFVSLVFFVCGALAVLALILPLLYRIGVEKGRIAFLILVAAIVAGAAAFGDRAAFFPAAQGDALATPVLLCALGLTAVLNAVSISASTAFYQKKER